MTRLHRLYRRRLQSAVNIIDEPENLQPGGQDELSYPTKYPQGEEPDNINSYPHGQMRIEGAEHTSTIIALKPTPEAAAKLCDAYPDIDIDPNELHITITFLGKGLDESDIEHLQELINPICDAHQPLDCHTQGLGVFDHIDEGGRPFYTSVDAPGLAALYVDLKRVLTNAGIDLPSEYDFTPHMTIGYMDPEDISIIDGSPDIRWTSDEIVIMHGGEHIAIKLGGMPKEASGFGFSLDEIITPSKGQGFTDNPTDNHQTENLSEDPDLKLGEVEEPYSIDQGPLNFRFENNPEENVVKGASIYRKLIASVGNIQRLLGFSPVFATHIHKLYPQNDFSAAKVIKIVIESLLDDNEDIGSIATFNEVEWWLSQLNKDQNYIKIIDELYNPNISSNKVKFVNNFKGDWEEFKQQYYTQFANLDQSEVVLPFQDGFKWVKVPSCDYDPMARMMQHCTEFAGDIYSLRDSRNKPHVTADVYEGDLIQIQGKQNTLPDQKYWPYVKELIIQLGIGVSKDTYQEIVELVPSQVGLSQNRIIIDSLMAGDPRPLQNASVGIKDSILNNPAGVSHEILTILAKDPSAEIRLEVAQRASKAILEQLINDPDMRVRSLASKLLKNNEFWDQLQQTEPIKIDSVAIPDSGSINENSYTDGDNTRQDRSIPRPPIKRC